MNRSHRRPTKIQSPLRGKLAATASPQLRRRYAEPVVFQHPSISQRVGNNRHLDEIDRDVELDLSSVVNSQPASEELIPNDFPEREPANLGLVKPIQLWQWFLIIILFVVLAVILWQFPFIQQFNFH